MIGDAAVMWATQERLMQRRETAPIAADIIALSQRLEGCQEYLSDICRAFQAWKDGGGITDLEDAIETAIAAGERS